MDETTRISENPDLTAVFGELDDDRKASIKEQLEAADKRLAELRDTLNERSGREWDTTGVSLETYDSGQAMVTAIVKDEAEGITFTAELRPGNFFDDTRPWRPGEPPRAMATDAWDVEGEVQVMTQTRVQGRKYTVQESAAELPEQRHETPETAVSALATYVDELCELALSRDPVAKSWQSDGEDAAGDASADAPTDE